MRKRWRPRSNSQQARRRPNSPRRAARLLAAQALYQIAITGGSPEKVIVEFLFHRQGQTVDGEEVAAADSQLFADIVRGAVEQEAELDDMIAGALKDELEIERLETVLKVLLRAGVFELVTNVDTNAQVLIEEYLAVAEAFYGAREKALANAVLDRLARALRPEEMKENAGDQTPVAP